jgi:hypothetical protein
VRRRHPHRVRLDDPPRASLAPCPDSGEEVAAFEELVGSHGGMGGSQSFPFVLFPIALPYPERAVVGAEGMHRVLRHWLVELGHDAYRDDAPVTAAGGEGSPPASR